MVTFYDYLNFQQVRVDVKIDWVQVIWNAMAWILLLMLWVRWSIMGMTSVFKGYNERQQPFTLWPQMVQSVLMNPSVSVHKKFLPMKAVNVKCFK